MKSWAGGRKIAVLAAVVILAAIALYAMNRFDEDVLPSGPPHVAGQTLFEKKRCIRCHRVSGTGGLVGPDLTAVAVRHDAVWLNTYLQDPKAFNPEAKMPRPRLTPEQRAAVIAYLRTLDGAP
jgi:cytochrome c2